MVEFLVRQERNLDVKDSGGQNGCRKENDEQEDEERDASLTPSPL